jgi:hypothetical protein
MINEVQSEQKSRWASGVIPYAQMGYWKPEYEPQDTDILCAFRVVPLKHGREMRHSWHSVPPLFFATQPKRMGRTPVVHLTLFLTLGSYTYIKNRDHRLVEHPLECGACSSDETVFPS